MRNDGKTLAKVIDAGVTTLVYVRITQIIFSFALLIEPQCGDAV